MRKKELKPKKIDKQLFKIKNVEEVKGTDQQEMQVH